jgi:hypothetical protein
MNESISPFDERGYLPPGIYETDEIDPIFINSDLDAQKAKYGVELVFGSNRAGFFQTDRYGNSKGIVVINL